MGAKSKPQERLTASELGLGEGDIGEGGSRTEVRSLGDPPPRGDTLKLEDDGSAAQKVVDLLAERKLI
jgi:electron transfer flavoprotein alpha/beta subunit